MKRWNRARTFVCLAVLCLLTLGLAPAGTSAALAPASLTVSPGAYVGGQLVTFKGNLGVTGQRAIRLQYHMGRPGDSWTTIANVGQTQSDGSFQFTNPARSMFNIAMRVVSAGAATPKVVLNAKSQDLTLQTQSELGRNKVQFGAPFTVQVDTTPQLTGRPDLIGTPVFVGRELTLQQRVDGEWEDFTARQLTNADGLGSFPVTPDQLAAAVQQEFPLVLRVRQEDWTKDDDQVGWFPSFPTPVHVVNPPARLAARQAPAAESPTPLTLSTLSTADPIVAPRLSGGSAGQSRGWGRSLWDFAWEYGESLTSRPARGTERRGWWHDTTTGLGRVSKHNGGLMIDSQRNREGIGDYGTTTATLRENARPYGRWEAKMRLVYGQDVGPRYHAVIELVRDAAIDSPCGVITVADVPVGGSTVGIGVRALSGNGQWTATKGVDIGRGAAAFAVEVAEGHISWFINGRVVGTVRSTAAVPDVPMTLRMRLVGDGEREMSKAQFISDWQRGFSLDPGSLTTSGAGLTRGTYSGGC